jgi:hypothetical protein
MNELNMAERLRQQALAGLEQVGDATVVAMPEPNGDGERGQAAKPQLSLPEGWEDAVDAWVRAGCPKADPIMFGLNLLALRSLAQLPPEQQLPQLREWQRRVGERRKNAGRQ